MKKKDVLKRWERKLASRKEIGTFRQLALDEGRIDFSSNDYLGFVTDGLVEVVETNLSSGSRASRLISGNTHWHIETEYMLAAYHGAESALLFNSGYDANVGLLGCIAQKGDTILYDELSHASIRDGLKLSLGGSQAFRHNDLIDLENKLQLVQGQAFVVTEGLFSMDGDLAPLKKMLEICKKCQAEIIIDEAHSNGVIGKKGKGLVSDLGMENEILARVHTFGKALGCHGAVVLGSSTLRDYLVNYARSFIFTTAISPHAVVSIAAAYRQLEQTDRIGILNNRIRLFKNRLSSNTISQFLPSDSPIQSWMFDNPMKCREKASILQEKGFDVKPIVAPTVPKGMERIRICIHASNTEEEVTNLADAINKI